MSSEWRKFWQGWIMGASVVVGVLSLILVITYLVNSSHRTQQQAAKDGLVYVNGYVRTEAVKP